MPARFLTNKQETTGVFLSFGAESDTCNAMSAEAHQLFKYKSGAVEAVIVGPKEGYLWKRIHYYRFEFCSKRKEWVKLPPDRENDQPHLRACVNKVNKWLKEYSA